MLLPAHPQNKQKYSRTLSQVDKHPCLGNGSGKQTSGIGIKIYQSNRIPWKILSTSKTTQTQGYQFNFELSE